MNVLPGFAADPRYEKGALVESLPPHPGIAFGSPLSAGNGIERALMELVGRTEDDAIEFFHAGIQAVLAGSMNAAESLNLTVGAVEFFPGGIEVAGKGSGRSAGGKL